MNAIEKMNKTKNLLTYIWIFIDLSEHCPNYFGLQNRKGCINSSAIDNENKKFKPNSDTCTRCWKKALTKDYEENEE